MASFVLGVLLVVGLTCGCQHTMQRQAERVARDWCVTLRASQVIPVYPLTEDLRPGDLFLVESALVDQRRFYGRQGYLPFEGYLGRLDLDRLPALQAPGLGYFRPPPASVAGPEFWAEAPLACLPSYSFTTRSGQGVRAAFPVFGVPVGLSFLGESATAGSITVTDARTYGYDEAALDGALQAWLRENRALLARHAAHPEPRFVRLVTRVYLASALEVTLRAAGTTAGGLDAGMAKSFALDDVGSEGGVDRYTEAMDRLNDLLGRLSEQAPGGSLPPLAASARSITLNQRFPRPVAIGYLAREYQILPGGGLGPSVSTLDLLEGRSAGAEIRREQNEAAAIAGEIGGRIAGYGVAAEVVRVAEFAAGAGVLARAEQEEIARVAAGDLRRAKIELQNLLLDFAAGGSRKNTCRLNDLLEALP